MAREGEGTALGAFLRARRELVDPKEHGLPDDGQRRVKGLRREELALLAGISGHYYTRLEQGRNHRPSEAVVEALGQALRLNEQALNHLRRLANATSPRRTERQQPEHVDPALEQLLELWTAQPTIVVGRYRDVLAANRIARLVNPGFEPGRNLLRDTFLCPAARDVYIDWEYVALGAVAGVRMTAGDDPADPVLRDMVSELSAKSQDFSRMWARYDVRQHASGMKRYRTRLVGDITLDYQTFIPTAGSGQIMFVFTAAPGSLDEGKLSRLATIAATDRPAD